jgi:hypothetical protein
MAPSADESKQEAADRGCPNECHFANIQLSSVQLQHATSNSKLLRSAGRSYFGNNVDNVTENYVK